MPDYRRRKERRLDARHFAGQLDHSSAYDVSERVWLAAGFPAHHLRAGSAEKIQDSVDEVRQIMRGRHHLAYGAKDDFAIETSDSFLSLWKDISQSFFMVTIAIASISLVVGGIVIMNIMLVSVTERTREIGIRKAMGARRSDILLQFLIESSTMAVIGGAIGVILGVLVAKIVSIAVAPTQCRATLVGCGWPRRSSERWPVLRNLSGVEGGKARSGGSAAIGVMN